MIYPWEFELCNATITNQRRERKTDKHYGICKNKYRREVKDDRHRVVV